METPLFYLPLHGVCRVHLWTRFGWCSSPRPDYGCRSGPGLPSRGRPRYRPPRWRVAQEAPPAHCRKRGVGTSHMRYRRDGRPAGSSNASAPTGCGYEPHAQATEDLSANEVWVRATCADGEGEGSPSTGSATGRGGAQAPSGWAPSQIGCGLSPRTARACSLGSASAPGAPRTRGVTDKLRAREARRRGGTHEDRQGPAQKSTRDGEGGATSSRRGEPRRASRSEGVSATARGAGRYVEVVGKRSAVRERLKPWGACRGVTPRGSPWPWRGRATP